jgi:hypothetical protein
LDYNNNRKIEILKNVLITGAGGIGKDIVHFAEKDGMLLLL